MQEAEADEQALEPFVNMLQFGLEALLLGDGAVPFPAGGGGMVAAMLHTVRRSVDASEPPLTDNM